MVKNRKRVYVKPRLEKVKLVPGEAVLGGCKTSSGDGQGLSSTSGTACTTGALEVPCQSNDILS